MNRILVVDDEADVLELVKTILVGSGYEVFTASSGEEALVTATSFNPDLIILDIVMPGISGLEVCRLLKNRKNGGGNPIIVMTALNRDIDRKYISEAGADALITKPFDITQLISTIDKIESASGKKV